MICAHILRAARNLATSSNKLLWALKKKDNLLPNTSIFNPFSIAAFTYAFPLLNVNAISCTAVLPASLIWYPEMEILFHLGKCALDHSKISVIIRMELFGG